MTRLSGRSTLELHQGVEQKGGRIDDEAHAEFLRRHEQIMAEMEPYERAEFEARLTPEYRQAARQFGRYLIKQRLALDRGLFGVARMSGLNPRHIDSLECGDGIPTAEEFRLIAPAYVGSREDFVDLLTTYQRLSVEARGHVWEASPAGPDEAQWPD